MADVRHPSGSFSLVLPDDWIVDFTVGGTEMIAYTLAGRFDDMAELAVFSDPRQDEVMPPVAEWAHEVIELWTGGRVIDFGQRQSAGRPADWVLATHYSEGLAVTVEHWVLDTVGRYWTVPLTCASVAYDRFADTFSAIMASFELHPEASR